MKRGLLTIALLSAFPGQASAAPIQPTDKWVLNFADERCLATRNYGTGQRRLYLGIKPAPTGGLVQLFVARDGAGAPIAEQGLFKLTPAGKAPITTTALSWYDRTTKFHMLSALLTPDQFALIRDTNRIEIIAKGQEKREFALTSMPILGQQIDACVLDLQKYWNLVVDPAAAVTRAEPIAPLHRLFNTEDYPSDAIHNSQGGTVKFIALVDEGGVLRDCTVIEASGIATLDTQTCNVVKERGKFRAGLTVDGKPAKSWLEGTIRWEIPN